MCTPHMDTPARRHEAPKTILAVLLIASVVRESEESERVAVQREGDREAGVRAAMARTG